MSVDEHAAFRAHSCGRRPPRSDSPTGVRRAARALALLLVAGAAAPAAARDAASLLDLTIPAARVPDWVNHDGRVPVDTSSWTVVPVHAVDCANNSVSDRTALTSAIASAPARSVLQLDGGGCVYNVEPDVPITRGQIVIRGGGMDQTVVMIRGVAQGFIVNSPTYSGSRSWTGGFRMGDTELTLASTTGLVVGDYVRMSASLPAGAVARQTNHTFIAKIASIASPRITLDVPLPTSFETTSQRVERFAPLRNVGIENLTLRHAAPTADMSYRYFVLFRGAVESWITGVRFGGSWSHAVSMVSSSRVVVRGNVFSDQVKPDPWNKAALKFGADTATNQVERNAFLGTEVSIELESGSVHNVIAYNFIADPDGPCERGLFLHNDYAAANLFEGNDIACPAQWDDYWGSSGPHNTFFRNRLRDGADMLHGQFAGRLGGEYLHGRQHLAYNILANHVKDLAGGPQPDQAVDSYGIDFWLERNVYTGECTLAQSAGSVAPECGSRQAPYAARTTWRSNHNGSAAPSAWSTVRIPASLYRTGPPAWWCSESGTFPNVGAPSDDATSGPAAFPKLPAQRLGEGLACGGAATPPAVPAAPVLLEN